MFIEVRGCVQDVERACELSAGLIAKADEPPAAPSRAPAVHPPETETPRSTMPPAPMCKESGPPDASYTVNLCVTASPAGIQVAGQPDRRGLDRHGE